MSTLAKPILRGHCYRRAIKTIIAAVSFAAINSSCYYFFIARPKKEAYHEFLRNYDEEEHFKELEKYGLLSYKERLGQKKT